MLLADAFEKFINTCLKHYELDPCHYFSCPGLSCDAMSKMKKKYLALTSIYLLQKYQEKEFHTLLKDMLKQLINTWMVMILKNLQHLLVTWIKIICIVGQWVNIFLMKDLRG